MSKISKFIDYYIKGKYHCDKCPCCWGGGYNAGCDDYDDCGCYIKGDIQDTCRLLPPFRFLLGYFKKKKSKYYFNHQYDDLIEFYEQDEKKQGEFSNLLSKFLKGYELCWKDQNGTYNPINTEMHIAQEWRHIRSDYDDFAHPIKHIPLKTQWENSVKNTFKHIINVIKPYFCK